MERETRSIGVAILWLLAAAGTVAAQQEPRDLPLLYAGLPILDLPDNFGNGRTVPSMQQSLALTQSWYQLLHAGLARALSGRPRVARLSILAADLLASYLPPGQAWLHEEWHRAVMSNRGISSYDGTYDLPLFAKRIPVTHVLDADLVRLKAGHPAEQVRLMEAGLEGDRQFVLGLEKGLFYTDGTYYALPLLWMSTANAIAYVYSHGRMVDDMTDEQNRLDGTNVAVRDFAGHDFAAWAYDLHRPQEPYAARGVHPSGVGINRYIRWSDLSADEKSFLRLQGRLAFLNLLDANLLGVSGFALGKGENAGRGNVSVIHLLTSFGYTVDANVFMSRRGTDLFAALHNYFNGERWFPGIELERLRQPVSLAGRRWLLSSRGAVWLQPRNQEFRTTRARPGALVALTLAPGKARGLRPFVQVEAKTEGWVAGNVHLGPGVNVRIGIQ